MTATRRLLIALLAALAAGAPAVTVAGPAAADDQYVPGNAVVRVSKLPKVILPGTTISPTIEITQTTPYELTWWPALGFSIYLDPMPADMDISARMQSPVTGAWLTGTPEVLSDQVTLRFPYTERFALPVNGRTTVRYEIHFGADTPVGYYWPMIGAGIVPPPETGKMVETQTVPLRSQQIFHVGALPAEDQPTTAPPAPGRTTAPGASRQPSAGPSPAPVPASASVLASAPTALAEPAGGGLLPPAASPPPPEAEAESEPEAEFEPEAEARVAAASSTPLAAGLAVAVVAVWIGLIGRHRLRVRRLRRAAGPVPPG
ncbi:hypothetical protein ACQEVZ_30420 [Dactylosporangium sp. CA-152071]|uniref:hypothetical protein n=1 Tax=Dactylosporangium sp. CA-152071 TaxID=3239933 RepID=UPI003D8E7265